MQINISGHGIKITPVLRQHIESKLRHLAPIVNDDTLIHIVLAVEKLEQIAKATLHFRGHDLCTSGEADDLYSAINILEDKLHQLIIKHNKLHQLTIKRKKKGSKKQSNNIIE